MQTLEQQKADLLQRLKKLEREFADLEARLIALEAPQPPAQAASEPLVFPDSPLRCHCEEYEEDADGWTCLNCGGGRF